MRLSVLWLCAISACPVQAQDASRLGVFGVVESVDPLVVAGREIGMPEEVRVISPLGPGQEIAVGDTLAIAAFVDADRLVAARVLEFFPLVGPVAGVKEGTATVMGTQVHIPPDVSVRAGQWVALSGLWSGDQVITTKLRRADAGGFGQLAGVFEADMDPEQMGGSAVIGAQTPKDGFSNEIWTFSGQPERSGLRVRLMSKGVFGGKVDLVLWQGYASLPVASQTYMIHGTGVTGTAPDAFMPAVGALVTRCAVQGRVVKTAPDGLEAAFEMLGCVTGSPAE